MNCLSCCGLSSNNSTWCQKSDGYYTAAPPREAFNFNNPDDWPKWKRRFEQYCLASGLSKEAEERQVSAFLYCLGENAEDVLVSTNISSNDKKVYGRVIAQFDMFFKVRKNTIFESARFNRRIQIDGESAEQFITCLYQLAEDCAYGDLREEMIRDLLVVGIRDSTLSERLQMDADLTLDSVKNNSPKRGCTQTASVTEEQFQGEENP